MGKKRNAKKKIAHIAQMQPTEQAPAATVAAIEPAPLLKHWFDHLQRSLKTEAEQVGLFEQSTMTGNAREFLVQRVLRSILPPLVHIGSGRVFDSRGHKSKQIDVVLFDARFPVFEVGPISY